MKYVISLFLVIFLSMLSPAYASQWVVGVTGGAGGIGDVVGPVSSTDNAIARYHLVTGKIIQNSLITIDDTGIMTLPAGSVTAPSIVSDDADSGFYFGSKGFNWGVDGVFKFGVDVWGNITGGKLYTSQVARASVNQTLSLGEAGFTDAGNMINMAVGTTTFTGFDGEIVGVNIMPTVGVLDDGDIMTLLNITPTGTPASTLGVLNGIKFGNWGGTGTDKARMINIEGTGWDATFRGTASYSTADAAGVEPTRPTKSPFVHTRSLAADTDDACGTEDDCLTLPIPTTMGFLEMWTDGSLYLSAVCVNAGTCTVTADSDAAGVGVEYNAAIASCTGLCLHDGGTNSTIFNDTAGAVTVTVRFTYD